MISQRDLPARIFSIRWETLLLTWTNQFYFDVSQSNMEVGWEDCFPCWSLRSEGSGKKLAIYGARLARRKRGETEVNSKWYSLFVAHVHHDRPRHSKTIQNRWQNYHQIDGKRWCGARCPVHQDLLALKSFQRGEVWAKFATGLAKSCGMSPVGR